MPFPHKIRLDGAAGGFVSGSHQIPVISLPIPPDRCSFRNFGLNLFYEHLSNPEACFFIYSC